VTEIVCYIKLTTLSFLVHVKLSYRIVSYRIVLWHDFSQWRVVRLKCWCY